MRSLSWRLTGHPQIRSGLACRSPVLLEEKNGPSTSSGRAGKARSCSPLLPIVVVRRHHFLQRRRAAVGFARVAVRKLRPRLGLLARSERIEDADGAVVIEVFVIIDVNRKGMG